MKQKHFTFDLDYFPVSSSNVFQKIKIEPKNKNINPYKNGSGLKRFSIKNELNFHEIPEIMYFQKSIRKTKAKPEKQILTPSSNKTKMSNNDSDLDIMWSFQKKIQRSKKKDKRIESCPKTGSIKFSYLNESKSNEKIKFNSLIQIQRQNLNQKQKLEHKKSQQLESLEQCQSEFDESSQNSPAIFCAEKNTFNLLQKVHEKKNYKQKYAISQKHNKSKKTDKSQNSKGHQNNPQVGSNKNRIKKQPESSQSQKDQKKLWNSLLMDENDKKNQKKFISLKRKSYYVIGSKSKNRSLNKQKKAKNESLRQEANIILTNGDCTQYSSSVPSNCRISSLTSTVNSKGKVQKKSSKSTYQDCREKKVKIQFPAKEQLVQIMKKTGEILNKYKGECDQLRKQKQEYLVKYQEAVDRLNRIRQEIENVVKIN